MNHLTQITQAQVEDAALLLEHEMVEIVRTELGMHERQAFEIAKAIVRGLRGRYGGVRLGYRGLYIPAPSKVERNAAIREEYDGTNFEEVMSRHGIRRAQLYRILGEKNTGPKIGLSSAKSPISSHEMRQQTK